ncbi:hypothetical protein [Natranaerobius trueperi]|nr:hypothetical protein [Natranaerobius trueperi]
MYSEEFTDKEEFLRVQSLSDQRQYLDRIGGTLFRLPYTSNDREFWQSIYYEHIWKMVSLLDDIKGSEIEDKEKVKEIGVIFGECGDSIIDLLFEDEYGVGSEDINEEEVQEKILDIFEATNEKIEDLNL